MKKKIGISFSKTNFQYYWNWFSAENLKDGIELVELSFQKNNVEDIYRCDGFVLTGGVDIDPAFYNGQSNYDNKPDSFQPERDKFEEKIFHYSQTFNLPLLGICRGLQLVNVLQGGTLIDDLSSLNEKHKKEDTTDKEHTIKINENSLLNEIVKIKEGEVNSAHHQAIDTLGKELMINSHADDGTIEGIEWKDKTGKPFMLCVQWHPERMFQYQDSPLSKNIRKRFIEEIKKSSSFKK